MSSQKRATPKAPCKNCGDLVPKSRLRAHLVACQKRYEESAVFRCAECADKAFKKKKYLYQHIQKVHSEPVKCEYPECSAVVTRLNLSQHVKRVHERRKEECANCGKEISYGNLRAHLQMCTSDGSRPFGCTRSDCEAKFRTKHERAIHVSRVHRKSASCSHPNCEAVVNEHNLRVHVRTAHAEEPREECTNCGKKVTSAYLSRHLKRCTSRKSVGVYVSDSEFDSSETDE